LSGAFGRDSGQGQVQLSSHKLEFLVDQLQWQNVFFFSAKERSG
jgi:hypothetical protein